MNTEHQVNTTATQQLWAQVEKFTFGVSQTLFKLSTLGIKWLQSLGVKMWHQQAQSTKVSLKQVRPHPLSMSQYPGN